MEESIQKHKLVRRILKYTEIYSLRDLASLSIKELLIIHNL